MIRNRENGVRRLPVTFGRFDVFREDVPGSDSSTRPALSPDFQLAYIGEERMDELASLAGRNTPIEDLQMRFMCRNLCLAVQKDQQIIAFSWASFGLFQFESYMFQLMENEAYLFDAYTVPAYRGRGLAGVIRRQLHRDLAAMGRARFYSVTLRNNTSAMRFKHKMDGRVVDHGFYIRLFDRWSLGTRARPHRVRAGAVVP